MTPDRLPHIGVLVMEYGEPTTLADIVPYLTAHYHGYPPSPQDIAFMRERCQRVWSGDSGSSAARRLAVALADELTQRYGSRFQVVLGARHWHPTVADALTHLVRTGVQHVIVLPLSPIASHMSMRSYQETLDRAQESLERPVHLHLIPEWPELPGYVSALTTNAVIALERLVGNERRNVALLAIAHSVAESARKPETDYQWRLHRMMQRLIAALGCAAGYLAYYSAEGPGQWLGPDVLVALEEIARAGFGHVLAVPINTVYDNVEVCYELDVRIAERAAALGLRYARSAIPNAAPALIADLATLVADATAVFDTAG
ncbi:MAG: ferrochelatase [Roseiflexaceae bacterium]|nr:ferrochelatase [Roseiflexus sp.]MDW8212475.1 ferrochelatase [Roseiflexaceae bacterium]